MANQEHVAILKQGVEVWNKWREDNPDVKMDIIGANLGGANLYGANLGGANLGGADLSGANLIYADLSGANLSYAKLGGADLSGAKLGGAKFGGAKFGDANLSGADLSGADLSGANLSYAKLGGAKLSEKNLRDADLSGADLSGADLSGADFSGANLRGANLRGAKLSEKNLRDADLRSADLSGADLSGADLKGAKLNKARLFKVNLSMANLTETDAEEADFERADFHNVNLERAFLGGANLKFIKVTNNTLLSIPENLKQKYEKTWFIVDKITKEDNDTLIIRSIEFPPEYHQAGISILSYFGDILRKNYPDTKAKIIIEQDGLKVKMIIDPVETGNKEIIEKALDDYGLVITGDMKPDELLSDPLDVIALSNKLEIAQMELRQTKQLHQFAEKQHSQRIQSLEEQVNWLRNTVGTAVQSRPVTVSPKIFVAHDLTNSTAVAGDDNEINEK